MDRLLIDQWLVIVRHSQSEAEVTCAHAWPCHNVYILHVSTCVFCGRRCDGQNVCFLRLLFQKDWFFERQSRYNIAYRLKACILQAFSREWMAVFAIVITLSGSLTPGSLKQFDNTQDVYRYHTRCIPVYNISELSLYQMNSAPTAVCAFCCQFSERNWKLTYFSNLIRTLFCSLLWIFLSPSWSLKLFVTYAMLKNVM